MADSNITKRALASALKALIKEIPFSKITVAQICEKCDMNRKSFYYHFKDKYDLVNWIFDMDFITLVKNGFEDKWELVEEVCLYFYENKAFYREVLKIRGQNSFMEHIQELLYPILENKMKRILNDEDIQNIYIECYRDMVINVMERWIISKEDIPPDQFIAYFKKWIFIYAAELCKENRMNEVSNDREEIVIMRQFGKDDKEKGS